MELFCGEQIIEHINELGRFRIEIFREYPYLYDGDMEYEVNYLSRYSKSKEGMLFLIKDSKGIVGASTAIPLKDEVKDFKEPFDADEIDKVFYIGETMIRADCRGKGLGHKIITCVIQSIEAKKYPIICFYTVKRDSNHPEKPEDYIGFEFLWERYGFKKVENKLAFFSWKDLGDKNETVKPMELWIRR